MKNELNDKIELSNGLILELLDRSRRIAGDRWVVSFAARVEIDVKPEYLAGDDLSEDQIKGIQALAGEKACYNYENQKNFVADTEKDAILKEFREGFLDTNLEYLSSPVFPKKLILRKLKT